MDPKEAFILAKDLLDSVDEDNSLSNSMRLQMLVISLRESIEIVRRIAKYVPQLDSLCSKTARNLEVINSKATLELNCLIKTERFKEEYKDDMVICIRCQQPSFFWTTDTDRKCQRCGYPEG